MNLNDMECTILDEALSQLLTVLQESAPQMDLTTRELMLANLNAVRSARQKLKHFSGGTQKFSLPELKVMYAALESLKEDTDDYLAQSPLTDPNRNTALDTQRSCNQLLRNFIGLFAQEGIDIRKTMDIF